MRVLIEHGLGGNPHAQAGQVLDLPEAEAKDMIARGTAVDPPVVAETSPAEPPAELPGVPDPEPDQELAKAPETTPADEPKKKRTRASTKKRRG
jgi:hypothetical protein